MPIFWSTVGRMYKHTLLTISNSAVIARNDVDAEITTNNRFCSSRCQNSKWKLNIPKGFIINMLNGSSNGLKSFIVFAFLKDGKMITFIENIYDAIYC